MLQVIDHVAQGGASSLDEVGSDAVGGVAVRATLKVPDF